MKRKKIALTGALAAVTLGATAAGGWHSGHGPVGTAQASSHREAPLIAQDPEADSTDLYAFVAPDAPDSLTIVSNYHPFENPEGGPNFDKFGDDVVYRINIDNNGDAEEDIVYEFNFKTTTRNPATFLYNTGPVDSITSTNLNVVQTYTAKRIVKGRGGAADTTTVLGDNIPVAPANVGTKSMPNYAAVSNGAITNLPGGGKLFAGQADDPFFVDLRVFDLLTVYPAGQAHNSTAGFNIHSIVIQVPISSVTSTGAKPAGPTDNGAVVGLWATNHRWSMKVYSPGQTASSGSLVQVSRLGMPLVNEVVAPRGAKDLFNSSHPRDDAQFLAAVTDPELAKLMNAVLMFPAPTTNRTDLVQVFLTGIPGATMPPGVKPSEQLRINLGVPVTANPNPMGVLAGDLQGFPNGRRLADNVVDISLQAVGGVLQKVPGAEKLSGGVMSNDLPFRTAFPYLALPHPGNPGITVTDVRP